MKWWCVIQSKTSSEIILIELNGTKTYLSTYPGVIYISKSSIDAMNFGMEVLDQRISRARTNKLQLQDRARVIVEGQKYGR